MLFRAIIGQQITVAAARTALTRLDGRARRSTSTSFAARPLLFPTMAAIAERGRDALGSGRARSAR